ncbi:hypothetical protein P153DRAFT_375930 [Dothidotthia symphoricarpi CBS 119687]|uniref:Uncharacterized protein n=1 Tax=Dothidotthia symphoricarpi CBS 119687 TaxID=1392245 RepID=A0A6A6AEW4_9PLEO|nr:uncharacterized protein P153DRAFT_375930 [Dothidotthia symphoricarpi CBS 119687]KAF2129467.1 hypothetical protein P153DRAFT_375930 [Dothidotthia symphoricarpi CBS 119687]
MAWFMRGVQSAVFHYASCAPCAGYKDSKRRRREAKLQRKAREKLMLEDPEAYHHPEPTGTNPYWSEEMALGPGPPPRRARRANTGSTRGMGMGITKAGTQSTVGGSTIDVHGADDMRLSDDTLEDENWNRKRYQREDEDLWGLDEAPLPIHHTTSGSSTTLSMRRPGTSASGSYYSARAPPVNDLHPPIVSMPSPDPADNRWMLQPPPKASVMAGKERARNRSRSGSGASSRVELGLQRERSVQRRVSTRRTRQTLDRGQIQDLPSISPQGSYTNLLAGQRHDRCRTPQARPPSSSSSHFKPRDTPMVRTDTMTTHHSPRDPTDALIRRTRTAPIPDIKVIRVRQSRQLLSTVQSSATDRSPSRTRTLLPLPPSSNDQNALPEKPSPVHNPHTRYSTTSSPASSHPYTMKPRASLTSTDISPLNALQSLVPSDSDRDVPLAKKHSWANTGFGVSRAWGTPELADEEPVRVPFDSLGAAARDPKFRWSVDF